MKRYIICPSIRTEYNKHYIEGKCKCGNKILFDKKDIRLKKVCYDCGKVK